MALVRWLQHVVHKGVGVTRRGCVFVNEDDGELVYPLGRIHDRGIPEQHGLSLVELNPHHPEHSRSGLHRRLSLGLRHGDFVYLHSEKSRNGDTQNRTVFSHAPILRPVAEAG